LVGISQDDNGLGSYSGVEVSNMLDIGNTFLSAMSIQMTWGTKVLRIVKIDSK